MQDRVLVSDCRPQSKAPVGLVELGLAKHSHFFGEPDPECITDS